MQDRGPDPKQTVEILDRLVSLRLLNETQFRRMHHLGGSISAFRNYCRTVKSFHADGNNRGIHEHLQKMLEAYERSQPSS